MYERHADQTASPHRELLHSALLQLEEDARMYDVAVESFNTHLENHRERRDLHDIPRRAPIREHDGFDAAVGGHRDAIESMLAELLSRVHLDSAVRRHPRAYAIHLEAVEHLEIARDQLVITLEATLRHLDHPA